MPNTRICRACRAKLGQVDAPTFIQAVTQASVAVSREENRPVLTGVRMQFDGDKVTMTSTDRFRLARATLHLDAAEHRHLYDHTGTRIPVARRRPRT